MGDRDKTKEQLINGDMKSTLEAIVAAMVDPVIVFDNEGVCVFANKAFSETFGLDPKDYIGKFFMEIPGAEVQNVGEVEKYAPQFWEAMKSGRGGPVEFTITRVDGERIPVSVTAGTIKDPEGNPTHLVTVLHDISKRKSIEDDLKVKNDALEHSINAMAIVDVKGYFTYGNRAFFEMWGYESAEEVLGKPGVDFWEDKNHLLEIRKEVLGKGSWTGDVVARKKDSSTFEVHLSASAVKGESGSPICMLATAVDLTSRKRAEEELRKHRDHLGGMIEERTHELTEVIETLLNEIDERERAEGALRESEERFQQVAENAQEWIWEVDADGLYTYASPVLEEILGYKPEEIVGKKHFYDLFHPDDREKVKKAAFEVFDQKQPFREFPNLNVHKNGREVWLSTSGVPILDEKGNLLGYRGADTDITERKRAEEKLVKSEANYRAIFDSANDAIFIHDLETGDILDVNKKMCEMYGYTVEEARRVNVEALSEGVPPYTQEDALTWIKKAVEGEPQLFEWTAKDKAGKLFWVEVNLKRSVIGGDERLLAIVRDITERKRAAEMENKAKKEAEFYLDLMSHDLTNFNQTILGNINLMERQAVPDEKGGKYLESCKRQVMKSENLISRVRAFSQVKNIESEKLKAVDLSKIVQDAIKMVKGLYPRKHVEVEFAPAEERMAMGSELLETVFSNLIENAVKHSAGEKVRIAISIDESEDEPGKFWEIRIEDSGPGIPDKMKEKIFERYSRIGEEKGTGLGLSLVRVILEKYGGRIRAKDRVNGKHDEGSVFKIIIPKGSSLIK